jgi:plastocyanin
MSPKDLLAANAHERYARRISIRGLGIGILVALFVPAAPALAANQTVTATSFNQFTPKHVGVNVGEMVTWNNGGGLHNVHFDDNSYVMPPSASGSAWSVQRTFNTPGTHRYYCDVHGGPNGVGMSGTVAVNTGYPRPKGASPLRTSLAVAYKPCTVPNRQHGPPLANPSCSPPVQESDWLTVGTPDATPNGPPANSIGAITMTAQVGVPGGADDANVQFVSSMTDVRRKDLTDYPGELQTRLALRVTDRHNGPSFTEPATGDTTFTFTIPCATTMDPAIGSTCSATTTADALVPGAVLEGRRSIWEFGKVQVFDGGSDGVASTTPNTLFADQAVFVP